MVGKPKETIRFTLEGLPQLLLNYSVKISSATVMR